MRWIYLLINLSFFYCLAQGPGPDLSLDDEPPGPRPFASTSHQLSKIGTDSNYFSFLPTGGVDFELENLGVGLSTFEIVFVRKNGTRQSRLISVAEGAKTQISGDPLAADDEIYVLSMQPFRQTTAAPIESTGNSSRLVRVNSPTNPLTLRNVKGFNGSSMTVGIDPNGLCHYPIHGEIIGQLLENGSIKLHQDGAVYTSKPL